MRSIIKLIVNDFGGIVAFYGLLYTAGLKAAIAGSLVFILFDIVRRRRAGIGFPRIYILSSGLAIGFGAIDLISKTPFMLQYEAAITNAVLAGVFAAGARGKSMIEEMVAERDDAPEITPEVSRFFQVLTLGWAAFFAFRAVSYLAISLSVREMGHAMTARMIFGNATLVLMLAAMTQGRRLFFLCRRLGLLGAAGGQAALAEEGISTPISSVET